MARVARVLALVLLAFPLARPAQAGPADAPGERAEVSQYGITWIFENRPDYGREITDIVSTVGLLLLLDDPQRRHETLLLRSVQKGRALWRITL